MAATGVGCGMTEDAPWGDGLARDGSVARVLDATPRDAWDALAAASHVEFEAEAVDLDIKDGDLAKSGVKLEQAHDALGRPIAEWTCNADDLPFPMTDVRLSGKASDGRDIRVRLDAADGGKRTLATVRIGPKRDTAFAREILDRAGGWIARHDKPTPPRGPVTPGLATRPRPPSDPGPQAARAGSMAGTGAEIRPNRPENPVIPPPESR